mgnify:CR=1 FL=1
MTSNLYTALINLGDIIATEISNPQCLSATYATLDTPITNPTISGQIVIGNNSFEANELGELLSILFKEYPELRI